MEGEIMAENKNAKKAAQAAEAAESDNPQEHMRKEKKKSRWTADTCMHAAKRFATRDEWAHGAPSSFKAAVAKGWDGDCCAHMTVKTSTAKAQKAAKTKAPAAAVKKKASAGRNSRTA
jgi:hypothetical protein